MVFSVIDPQLGHVSIVHIAHIVAQTADHVPNVVISVEWGHELVTIAGPLGPVSEEYSECVFLVILHEFVHHAFRHDCALPPVGVEWVDNCGHG